MRLTTRSGALVAGLATLAAFLFGPVPAAAAGYGTGYDISWPQCGAAYPGTPFDVAVVGVTGGSSFSQNQCLVSEFRWALQAKHRPDLYINTDLPTASPSQGQDGPAGHCAAGDTQCFAYNYGYNNALTAVNYATGHGVDAVVWWLDVETNNWWQTASHKVSAYSTKTPATPASPPAYTYDTSNNARAVRGGLDGLTAAGKRVGAYSTNYQWNTLVGSYAPSQAAVWYATAGDLAHAPNYCDASHSFTGGPVWLVQYASSSNGTAYDGDYACTPEAGWSPWPNTGVTPSAGPTAGGTSVTISGSGFTGATDLFFGSTDVKSACPASGSSGCFTVVNDTTITATTPAAPAGPAGVSVATPNGTMHASGTSTYLYVAPGVYTPLQPYRVLDTRQGSCVNCGNLGPVGSGATRTFSVAPTGPVGQVVPANALSVVLNVTAVNATSSTFVTVYPSGASQPTASNLNLASAAPISNLVVSAVGTNRSLNAYNLSGSVDLIADVQGYFSAPVGATPAGQFHAVSPTRVCDTRAATGTPCDGSASRDYPLGSTEWRRLPLTKPSANLTLDGATAAAFNLTGTGDAANTFLSVTPPDASDRCPTAAPTFSNLNLTAGATQPIRVVVPVGPTQDVCVFNLSGSINVILDVNGWFGSAGDTAGSRFYAVSPLRMCDTRSGEYACPAGSLGQGGVVSIPAPPMGAPVAIALNATAVLPAASTFLTVYPADTGLPPTSDLNVMPNQVLPNFAFVKVASGGASPGSIHVYNLAGNVNVVVDLVGWFQ